LAIHVRRKRGDAASAFDGIVPDLYDALHQPEAWPALLSRVQDAAKVKGVYYAFSDAMGRPFIQHGSEGLPQECLSVYHQHYYTINPFLEVLAELPVGEVLMARRDFDRDFIRRDVFHNEFLAPIAGFGDVMIANLLCENGDMAVVGFNADVAGDSFDERDIRNIRPLLAHLRRIAQLQRRLASIESSAASLRGILNRLASGVVVVSGDGRLRYCNEAAEQILRADDGLFLHEQRLGAHDKEASVKLERLIVEAAQCATGEELHEGGGELVVPRANGRRRWLVLVAPLPEASAYRFGCADPSVAIFITDAREQALPETRLVELFRFTPAEARLAARLVAGDTLSEAADKFYVTKETVRMQLRSLMEKTDTNRQAALVRLLSAAAMFRRRL
jgi:DNA-binding CsgD family transcriptional regulator